MRRSFGANGGMGGGGGMLRTVQRAVRAGVGGSAQEPFSHSTATNSSTTTRSTYKPTTSNLLSLSSSTSSSFHHPVSSISNLPTWLGSSSPTPTTFSDEFEWECVDGIEDEKGVCAFYDDFVFGSVPSEDEVQHALSSLQQVLDPASFSQFIKDRLAYNSNNNVADEITSPTGLVTRVSSVGTELDWIEPSMQLCHPRMLQHHGSDRVYDAFNLLQTDPSIQLKSVVLIPKSFSKQIIIFLLTYARGWSFQLSSDKAVWDAVLSNEVVRELRESLREGMYMQLTTMYLRTWMTCSDGGSKAATNILSWIFDNTKAKVMELIDKVMKLVNELFQPPEDEKKATGGAATDSFQEKLRTSFMLSIVVLLIVVVSRAHRA
ncbi:hypothetical protein HYC85_001036 [Camellia sinensis]|uniref:Uncharacterized protein n=1 Tax=Camellia sinensis TaxID=4442 RepID=A0A7J7I5B1_CAMSI|nr:hypothetical protein HYC85_001036 [Camellia sinensis]